MAQADTGLCTGCCAEVREVAMTDHKIPFVEQLVGVWSADPEIDTG
jgi:hypothetical protein